VTDGARNGCTPPPRCGPEHALPEWVLCSYGCERSFGQFPLEGRCFIAGRQPGASPLTWRRDRICSVNRGFPCDEIFAG
jgi:hypothetical protein